MQLLKKSSLYSVTLLKVLKLLKNYSFLLMGRGSSSLKKIFLSFILCTYTVVYIYFYSTDEVSFGILKYLDWCLSLVVENSWPLSFQMFSEL